MFRYDLTPFGALADLATEIAEGVLAREVAEGWRRRRRRPADVAAFRNAVAIIVTNLAHHAVFKADGSGSKITMPLKRCPHLGGRVPAGFCRTLRPTLTALMTIGVLTLHGPADRGLASTIEPSGLFANEVKGRGIGADHFGRDPKAPVVSFAVRDGVGRKHYQVWPASDEGAAIEGDMQTINVALDSADLVYVGGAGRVDTGDRKMVRHFTTPHWASSGASLAFGGRLFGGFWQQIKRVERAHIRIDGERVAEVDFAQAFPRLAYARQGAAAPSGDLYSLPGLEGLAGAPRGAVKKAMSCLLFARGRLRKWPDEVAEEIPEGWDVPRFRRAVRAAHPTLASVIETGIGHRLMRVESDILVRVLLRCAASGVTALPLHDAVACGVSSASFVKDVMEEEGRAVSGVSLPVSITHRTPAKNL